MTERIEVERSVLREEIEAAVKDALESSQRFEGPLTREQAAAYLQVHPDTLYHWAKDGLLEFSKLGDGDRAPMRFFREDLDRFAKERRRVGRKANAQAVSRER
jgi:excisionase family DNA binding protein